MSEAETDNSVGEAVPAQDAGRTIQAAANKLSAEDISAVEVFGLKIQNLQLQRTIMQKDIEKAGEMIAKLQEDMKALLSKYDVVVGRDQIAADGTITYNRG